MKPWLALPLVFAFAVGTTPVMIQDFEKATTALPSVWVVNIPNENATVRLSPDHPREGKQSLKLHYRFVAAGPFQYLGIPIKTKIQVVPRLRFALWGDQSKCSYGVQVTDIRGETHQYSKNTGQGGVIDFTGWKDVVIDLGAPHETWGGDRNGKIDAPITSITLTIGQPMADSGKIEAAEGDLSFDAIIVDSERSVDETLGCQIAVVSPGYGSDATGDVRVSLSAPGFREATARCWKPGGRFGEDSVVATVSLDAKGAGAFVLPTAKYPHGPITVRIAARNGDVKDTCYLQLYNKGGISWNEGLPNDPPPGAQGMPLAFSDDFRGPLSISSTDPKARYYDHKPPHGTQDFSLHPFTSHESPHDPFAQVDSYLRIRASDKAHSSGLISSMKNDASGVKVGLPCYFEARFLGPNAVGTWPGFWLMTDYMTNYQALGDKTPCDELDIIEAYGGEGPGSPNADDSYMITPHCWNQGEAGKALEKQAFEALRNPARMRKAGIPSTWFESFHTYGCKVTETDTTYYCDDVEVGRHPTLPVCRERPLFFMINLATGGGWPVDLSRYGQADMYVDYVRVYKKMP